MKPFCEYIKFNYGAIFGIKKNYVLRFTIENPCHGYIMERMWYTILG